MESKKPTDQKGGVTHKKDINAGSGAFNRGSVDDPHFDEGASDETPDPENKSKEPQNPKANVDPINEEKNR